MGEPASRPYRNRKAADRRYRGSLVAEMRKRGLLAILREEFGTDVTVERFLERTAARMMPCARRRPYQFWAWRGNCHVHIHRAVATLMLGRDLRPGEHIHHLDGTKHNNRPENLQIVQGLAGHRLAHGASGISRRKRGPWEGLRYGVGPNRGRLVHRVVMESQLGRPLSRDEVVVSVRPPWSPVSGRLRVLRRGQHLRFYALARRAGLEAARAAWFPGGALCGPALPDSRKPKC